MGSSISRRLSSSPVIRVNYGKGAGNETVYRAKPPGFLWKQSRAFQKGGLTKSCGRTILAVTKKEPAISCRRVISTGLAGFRQQKQTDRRTAKKQTTVPDKRRSPWRSWKQQLSLSLYCWPQPTSSVMWWKRKRHPVPVAPAGAGAAPLPVMTALWGFWKRRMKRQKSGKGRFQFLFFPWRLFGNHLILSWNFRFFQGGKMKKEVS